MKWQNIEQTPYKRKPLTPKKKTKKSASIPELTNLGTAEYYSWPRTVLFLQQSEGALCAHPFHTLKCRRKREHKIYFPSNSDKFRKKRTKKKKRRKITKNEFPK